MARKKTTPETLPTEPKETVPEGMLRVRILKADTVYSGKRDERLNMIFYPAGFEKLMAADRAAKYEDLGIVEII